MQPATKIHYIHHFEKHSYNSCSEVGLSVTKLEITSSPDFDYNLGALRENVQPTKIR